VTREIGPGPIERRHTVFRDEAFVVGQNIGWCVGQKKAVTGGKPMMGFVAKIDPAIAPDDRTELQGWFRRKSVRPIAARLEPRATRSANVQEREDLRQRVRGLAQVQVLSREFVQGLIRSRRFSSASSIDHPRFRCEVHLATSWTEHP